MLIELTSFRLVRDQANKTLDLYLQRVRKVASTMADTVLPPPSAAEPAPGKPDAPIPTDNDSSWAGWAISSFTNKITAANGEIEPTVSATKPAEPDTTRSSSVPRPNKSSPSAQLDLPKSSLRPAAQPLGRSLSDRPAPALYQPPEEDADDGLDAWDAMDDDNERDMEPFTSVAMSPIPSTTASIPSSPAPWENKTSPMASPPISSVSVSSRPSSAVSSANKVSAVPYDDGGEPDFAGWLAAKNQAKAKNPLLKGQSKPGLVGSAASKSKPRVAAPAKKIDTKPKDEDEDDGWGDAWD